MNITSTANSQYTPQVRHSAHDVQSKNKEEDSKAFDINSHQLESLDDVGNEMLNQILVGKTEREKTDIKIVMDGMLMFDASQNGSGALEIAFNKNMSKEAVLNKLDDKIEMQELSTGNSEILRIMKQLREMYKSQYSPLDVKV